MQNVSRPSCYISNRDSVPNKNYILTDAIVTHSNINSIQHLYKAITMINNIII